MKNSLNSSAQQPMIVKYVEALHNGIQSQALSRYAIRPRGVGDAHTVEIP